MNKRSTFVPIAGLALLFAGAATAQTTLTLDGTSGNTTHAGGLSTTGGLVLNQGFFVETLIVGGGGSGGSRRGGGGGAGGLVEKMGADAIPITAESHAIVVGKGADRPTGSSRGIQGANSSAFGLTALGGGGGAMQWMTATSGGSGGGGARETSANGYTRQAPGAGLQPDSASGGFGNEGGDTAASNGMGGGGGAGGAGVWGTGGGGGTGGAGGLGRANDITGTETMYAGGGGGSGTNNGLGGSGIGGNAAGTGAGAGATNTGSGGGGSYNATSTSGGGGSGIVIVRYAGDSIGAGTGGTISAGTGSADGYTLHQYKGIGTFAFDMSGVNLADRLGTTVTGLITGDGDLTFNGPGKVTLAAANSYTGNTTVSGGTLELADTGTLAFKVVAGQSNNNRITGFGNLHLNGALSFDLSEAGTGAFAWTIVDLNLNESYGSSFNVEGFIDQGGGAWHSTDDQYAFSTTTGLLTVIPEPNTLALLLGAGVLAVLRRRLRA